MHHWSSERTDFSGEIKEGLITQPCFSSPYQNLSFLISFNNLESNLVFNLEYCRSFYYESGLWFKDDEIVIDVDSEGIVNRSFLVSGKWARLKLLHFPDTVYKGEIIVN